MKLQGSKFKPIRGLYANKSQPITGSVLPKIEPKGHKQIKSELPNLTNTKLEDDNHSEKSPNRMTRNLFRGLFVKYQYRDKRERQPHFSCKYDLPSIRAPKFPEPDSQFLGFLPNSPGPSRCSMESPAAAEAAAAVVVEIVVGGVVGVQGFEGEEAIFALLVEGVVERSELWW